jgi:hypothetical protein
VLPFSKFDGLEGREPRLSQPTATAVVTTRAPTHARIDMSFDPFAPFPSENRVRAGLSSAGQVAVFIAHADGSDEHSLLTGSNVDYDRSDRRTAHRSSSLQIGESRPISFKSNRRATVWFAKTRSAFTMADSVRCSQRVDGIGRNPEGSS